MKRDVIDVLFRELLAVFVPIGYAIGHKQGMDAKTTATSAISEDKVPAMILASFISATSFT